MPTAMQTAASTVIAPDHVAPNGNGNGPANHSGPDAPLHGHAGAHDRLTDPSTPAGPLAPHPTPHTPHSTRLSPDQLALTIAAFLDGNMTLAEVCEYAEISLSDLHAWAQSDWALERFEMIRALSKLRDELIQAEAVPRARQVLVHLATIADPSESAASRESRRKAAMALVPEHRRSQRKPRPAETDPCSTGGPGTPDAPPASAPLPDATRLPTPSTPRSQPPNDPQRATHSHAPAHEPHALHMPIPTHPAAPTRAT